MRRFEESKNQDIDISPLIDVVFILLIFFMVSTTFVKDAQLEIERPSAGSATAASTKSIRVNVDQQGNIYLGDSPIRSWMLQSRVREEMRSATEKTVLVIADRRITAEKLVEVVDQCRLAGASNVGVITDQEYNATSGS